MNQQTQIALPTALKPLLAQLAEVKENNRSVVFDYETSKGEKEARSHVATLRKSKTAVNDLHKEAKEHALQICKDLDAGKRYLIGEIDAMVDQHMKPLDAKAARIAKAQREKEIEAQRIAMAEQNRINAEREKLQKEQEAFKAQQDEAERKRQANIRADNEAAERVATEKAARIRAEQDAQDAKQQAIDANARAEAAEAKIKQQEAIQAVKPAEPKPDIKTEVASRSDEYKRHINNAILATLMATDISETQAKQIITMIVKGQVPNVSINY